MAKAESKNAGFVFLHRSIRDHWIWKDALKLKWWIDILMECNHSDQKVSIGYDLIECKRGQSINSLLTWSMFWRIDVSTVRRFFNLLENDKMIVTENVQKTTRLTVCNYDSYNTISAGKAILKDTQRNSDAIPTQFGRNSDAIQTKNEDKNDTKNEDKNVFSGYSPQEIIDFKKFEKWILEHAPRVAKMKEPFTIKNFFALKEKVTGAEISEFLESMHNYEKLLINNRSSYLTILKWIKREKNGTHINGSKASNKQAGVNSLIQRGTEKFNRAREENT